MYCPRFKNYKEFTVLMNTLRKIFASAMVLAMAFSFFVGTSPVKAAASSGTNIKMAGLSTVYYLGSDMKRYVYPNDRTYKSWYADFSGVQTISQSELEGYPLGANVTMRPGTWLVKITTNPNVYAVEPGGHLRSIVSEANAISLWGSNWASKVVDVADSFFTNYTITTPLTAGMYPAGSLVKMANSADVYYFDGTNYRAFASEAAFTSNRFRFDFVQTAPSTMTFTPLGTVISGVESGLVDTSSGAGGSITGSGLSVALSSNTPASTTYLRTVDHSQAIAPFATFNFTASNDGDAVVNTVKLTRSGISADTDLQDVYLYDGATQLAEMTSFSNKVITFNNTAGLFTVPKGTTRTITVKGDISNGTSSVSGIILGINAASDVVASGATITGSFPMNGNSMAVNTVSDLGSTNISAFSTWPATMDPGLTNQELWRFSVTANSQDMAVSQIKLTTVGTISQTDLANFALQVGGVQVGNSVATMNTAKEVIFTFPTPYIIPSGQTKIFVLKGDVLNGTGRAFKFTIRKSADFTVMDNNYGVFVAPTVLGSAFTLVQPTAGAGTSINNGTVTISVAADSPSGNIPSAGTNIPLARFTYKANGEDIKINTVRVSMNEASLHHAIRNGKLYLNGSQVGSTDTVVAQTTTNLFTMTQVIPAGTTATFEYRADIIDDTTSVGLVSGQTIVISLVGGSTDATGQQSLSSILTQSATGRTMTVATGVLSVAKNTALAEYSAGNPTGVNGATGVKVGSLVINAGSAEGATISQIVVGDLAGGSAFGDNFQNLTLKNSAGTALATTQGTLSNTSGADYTFSLSPAITVPAGGQYVVDCYADILTGATGYTGGGAVGLEFVNLTGTTLVTSSDAYPTATPTNLQNDVIASAGGLTVTADSSTPIAQQVVMGDAAGATFTALQFAASTSEDINVTRIAITDTDGHSANLSNVSLWDGTVQVGQTLASFNGSNKAVFTLATPWVIPHGQNKILTIKAFVNAFPNATSNQTSTLALSSNTDIDSIGASSGTDITETVTSATGLAMNVVKTKITITKAADSPSGSSTGSTQQTVAKFNVTNSANVGNYQATLKSMTVDMSSTIAIHATSVRYITFYKDSVSGTPPNNGNSGVGSGNALASIGVNNSSTCTTAGQLTCVNASPANTFTNTAIDDAHFTDVVIAAGATKTIIVVADTSDALTNTHFSAGLASNSVIWDDGVTSTLTTVDSLPIAGSTLTY